MKFTFIITLLLAFSCSLSAQSLDELKNQLDEALKARGAAKDEFAKHQAEIDKIKGDISLLSGWEKGLGGLIGFDLSNSSNWLASPNPDASSSSLNIALSGFANKTRDGYFWHNKGILNKAWLDLDTSESDQAGDDDGLFDNGTVDLLYFSSLYGRKISDKFAISGLGELNTSVENFLNPGTLDFGVGLTYTPSPNFTVVMHPFNYHIAFSGAEGVESTGLLGAKYRADYTRTFANIGGKPLNWSTTLTGFIPYSKRTPGLSEWTWLNNLTYEIWRGIGVGLNFGLKNAPYQFAEGENKTQSFWSLGLSYTIGSSDPTCN